MDKVKTKAIEKLFFTEDRHTEKYRQKTTLIFFEGARNKDISLPLTSYLEKKLKFDMGDLALGVAETSNFEILTLEMDTKENDRVAVSISALGAIYGLWFKKDDVYVNSSISVGASFRESVVLAGLICEAALRFDQNNIPLMDAYKDIESKINGTQEITDELKLFTQLLLDYAKDFVWLNNSGDISYRELYIHSLPYTALVTKIIDERDNFVLFPIK